MMSNAGTLRWLHSEFAEPCATILAGTPFRPEVLASIAAKETGYLISRMRSAGLETPDILIRCVGDTKKRRKGKFPSSKQDLEERGPEGMFEVAREALRGVSEFSGSYRTRYESDEEAFCQGFGIFQYDIQFCRKDPEFFLQRQWGDFDECLSRFVHELYDALAKNGWRGKRSLSRDEEVGLAIAYNNGRYKAELNFAQGNRNSSTGLYYGQAIKLVLEEAESLNLRWR